MSISTRFSFKNGTGHKVLMCYKIYFQKMRSTKCFSYSAVPLSTINSNLLIPPEKHLSGAVKAFYDRNKYCSSSSDLKTENNMLPINQLLDYWSAMMYARKIIDCLYPAFLFENGIQLPNCNFYILERTDMPSSANLKFTQKQLKDVLYGKVSFCATISFAFFQL